MNHLAKFSSSWAAAAPPPPPARLGRTPERSKEHRGAPLPGAAAAAAAAAVISAA